MIPFNFNEDISLKPLTLLNGLNGTSERYNETVLCMHTEKGYLQ